MPSEFYILEEQGDNKHDKIVKSILCLVVMWAFRGWALEGERGRCKALTWKMCTTKRVSGCSWVRLARPGGGERRWETGSRWLCRSLCETYCLLWEGNHGHILSRMTWFDLRFNRVTLVAARRKNESRVKQTTKPMTAMIQVRNGSNWNHQWRLKWIYLKVKLKEFADPSDVGCTRRGDIKSHCQFHICIYIFSLPINHPTIIYPFWRDVHPYVYNGVSFNLL